MPEPVKVKVEAEPVAESSPQEKAKIDELNINIIKNSFFILFIIAFVYIY